MNYIKPLLSLSFWIDLTPTPLLPLFYWLFFSIFLLLIILGIVSGSIYKKQKTNFILRFSAKYLKSWFFTAGSLGFIFLFFNYERVSFFSARFWLILWFLGLGIWLFFIIKRIKKLPERKYMLMKKAQFEKYLPNKKK